MIFGTYRNPTDVKQFNTFQMIDDASKDENDSERLSKRRGGSTFSLEHILSSFSLFLPSGLTDTSKTR
jgi:hypothetical protein